MPLFLQRYKAIGTAHAFQVCVPLLQVLESLVTSSIWPKPSASVPPALYLRVQLVGTSEKIVYDVPDVLNNTQTGGICFLHIAE